MSTIVSSRTANRSSLTNAIDEQALSRPDDTYYSIPRNDDDLSEGFVDISCCRLANAINHAASWLHSALGEASNGSSNDVVAYQGPNDLRYPILALAVAKIGGQVSTLISFAWKTNGR